MLKQELARELGVTPARVTQLAAQGMPTGTVEAALRWRASRTHSHLQAAPRNGYGGGAVPAAPPAAPANKRVRPGNGTAGAGATYSEARRRRAVAAAETAERDLAERRGDTMAVRYFLAVVAQHYVVARDIALNAPGRIAAELGMPAIAPLIDLALRAVLSEIAQVELDLERYRAERQGAAHGDD